MAKYPLYHLLMLRPLGFILQVKHGPGRALDPEDGNGFFLMTKNPINSPFPTPTCGRSKISVLTPHIEGFLLAGIGGLGVLENWKLE